MTSEVIKKSKMDVKNIKIIYMDGSKMEKGQVIGAAIVEE